MKGLSPQDRARAIAEEAKRNLSQLAATRERHGQRARQFAQWVIIGSYGVFVVSAWFAYVLMEPPLGSELAVGIVAVASIFAVFGCQRLGDRAEVWYLARRASGGKVGAWNGS